MSETVLTATSIDGADLLDEICAFIRAHVKISEEDTPLVALWIVHTWVAKGSYFQPRLAITSPEPGCGKTTLLRLLELLVCNPLSASNITPAALFRTIADKRPTILIDEADTFLDGHEELRGIINAGFEKTGTVTRCVGNENKPVSFPIASPLAIAAIGTLPGTIMDRSIAVRMQRKEVSEKLLSLRVDKPGQALDLRKEIEAWAKEIFPSFEGNDPSAMPVLSSDRAADKLRPLISIADLAGDHWPRIARQSAERHDKALSDTRAPSTGAQLLMDIRAFGFLRGETSVETSNLLARLAVLEEAQWSEFGGRGRPLSAYQLASLLKPYGIRSHTIRFGTKTAKGYWHSDFADAFRRYLPST